MGRIKGSLFLVLVLPCLILGGYLFLAVYYKDSFSLNTWINGVYCTGKTVEEVNAELLSKTEAPILTITDAQGTEYSVNLEKTGCRADFKEPLSQHLAEQNPWLWVEQIVLKKEWEILPQVIFEEEALKEFWGQLPFVKEEKSREKTLEIVFTQEGYKLHDGLSSRLDLEKAYEQLLCAVREGKSVLSLAEAGCYYDLEPDREQEETLKLWEKIRDFQDCSLVYDMGKERIPLKGRIAAGFLKKDDNGLPFLLEGKLLVDEEQIEKFVRYLADSYDTYGAERTFQSTRGDLVVIKGGTYGTKLDKRAETKYLLERMKKQAASLLQEEAENLHIPDYERQGLFGGKEDISSTYIEIDMTNQKMYYYEEGKLLLETDVVTGNVSRRMGTPEGVNYVYAKQKNRVLRGPGYASFVKYWMPVNGGIGIHDAGWRNKFGGEIYKKGGSHGCINTPSDKMAELYDMVETGTPVVMFY